MSEVGAEASERIKDRGWVVLVDFVAQRARTHDSASLDVENRFRVLDPKNRRRDDAAQTLHDEVEDAIDLLLRKQRLVRVPPK